MIIYDVKCHVQHSKKSKLQKTDQIVRLPLENVQIIPISELISNISYKLL